MRESSYLTRIWLSQHYRGDRIPLRAQAFRSGLAGWQQFRCFRYLALICMLILLGSGVPRLQDPAQQALGRLLCTIEPELGRSVRLFELHASTTDSLAELTEVPLSELDLPYLFEGDEILIPPSCSAELICYYDSTRRTYTGACRLRLLNGKLSVVEGDAQCELIEHIETFTGCPLVAGRVDELYAGQFVRQVDAVGTPSSTPSPVHPVNTKVPPGKLELCWAYDGAELPARVILNRLSDATQWTVELPATACSTAFDVLPAESYSWSVCLQGAEPAQEKMFSVLATDEWKRLEQYLTEHAIASGSLESSLMQIHSEADLACLTAVFQYFGMQQETALCHRRIQELKQVHEDGE